MGCWRRKGEGRGVETLRGREWDGIEMVEAVTAVEDGMLGRCRCWVGFVYLEVAGMEWFCEKTRV